MSEVLGDYRKTEAAMTPATLLRAAALAAYLE